jgi:hypothetical protein
MKKKKDVSVIVPPSVENIVSKAFFDAAIGLIEGVQEEGLRKLILNLDDSSYSIKDKAGKIFFSFAFCLKSPDAYSRLFNETCEYYEEMHDWWTKHVPELKGKSLNDEDVSVDTTILKILGEEVYELMRTQIKASQNEAVMVTDPIRFRVLNQMLWCIYIGFFNPKFFQKNFETFGFALSNAKDNIVSSILDENIYSSN